MIQVTKPETVSLSDGLTLHVIQTEQFKSARLTVFTVLKADGYLSPRMTLLFRILSRGTERYPRRALLGRRLDELYGTTLNLRNVHSGDDHILSFTAEPLEDAFLPSTDKNMDLLGGTLDLLAQLILHPLTDADGVLRRETVEQEKKALCDDIIDGRSQPRSYAEERFRTLMYANEPCGVSLFGTPEAIMTVTAEEMTRIYREWLSDAHFEIFYIGRTAGETVAEKWKNAFGSWSPNRQELTETRLHPIPVHLNRADEERPLSQGKLCMSWASDISPVTEPQTMASAILFNELLGAMQGSFLFRSVREAQGLCYYCDSDYYTHKGVLTVSCGVSAAHRAEAETAILDCVRRVAEGDFADSDLDQARASYRNAARQIQDSPCAMENIWFAHALDARAGQNSDPSSRMNAVLAATREDVMKAAARFIPDTVYYLGGKLNGTLCEDDGEADGEA